MMMSSDQSPHRLPPRRQLLRFIAAALLAPAGLARADELKDVKKNEAWKRDHGRIRPPVPVPQLNLVRQDGLSTTFQDLLTDRITAVQLMFSRCTTTCPIQGAIFARVQKLIPDMVGQRIQLVSITVDPEHDTPAVMKAWLRRFKAGPSWLAATPDIADVERLRDFAGRGLNPADNHSTQVQMFNRKGQLVFRTGDLPPAEEIAAILRAL